VGSGLPHGGDLSGQIERARQLAIEEARLLDATRCHDVVVLDVTGLSSVTDFYVIGTGTSGRQMKGLMKQVEELAMQRGNHSMARSGYDGEMWLLCDLVDVVVHVFNQDAREYYDLDSLWGDARRVEWREEKTGK